MTNEVEILTESIELIKEIQSKFHNEKFIGPGATQLFNAYETLNGARLHLYRRLYRMEKDRMVSINDWERSSYLGRGCN